MPETELSPEVRVLVEKARLYAKARRDTEQALARRNDRAWLNVEHHKALARSLVALGELCAAAMALPETP